MGVSKLFHHILYSGTDFLRIWITSVHHLIVQRASLLYYSSPYSTESEFIAYNIRVSEYVHHLIVQRASLLYYSSPSIVQKASLLCTIYVSMYVTTLVYYTESEFIVYNISEYVCTPP